MPAEESSARRPLRFGVNYVPSNGWFYSWLDLDLDDVRADLEDVASIGADHVRIFPIWPWIQPGRGHLRQRAIDDVCAVVDVAGGLGLDVCVDLLQGHLSSFDFVPSWLTTWHRASIFTSEVARDGIHAYSARLTDAVTTRPNVMAVTVGNEINNLWPDNSSTIDDSRIWAVKLIEVVRGAARGVPVAYSLFDDALYASDHPFGADDPGTLGDISSVHSWVFNGTALDGPTGDITTSHAAYLACLVQAFGAEPDRPVWLQEVGAPSAEVPGHAAEEFVRRTINMVSAVPELCAITWWCSHDIHPRQLDFPEREYDLGLFTVDHRAKPHAHALREAIEAARRTPSPATRPALVAPVDVVGEPGRRAELAPGSDFHRAWAAVSTVTPARIVSPVARRV